MGTQEYFRQVIAAVREADRDGLISDKGSDVLVGLSGLATVGTLQRLARLANGDKEQCYLEIGVFQGLSLLSVAIENPELACFGIDNFSLMDPKGENRGIIAERARRLDATNAHLINMDYEAALAGLGAHLGGRKVGVFFIDGPHDYRAQLMGLLLVRPYLAERAVIVVDDANYFDVRQATCDFLLSHPEFKLVFEAYSPAHPANLDASVKQGYEKGWLNGAHVLVHDPEGVLPVMLPPVVPEARDFYLNDWLVHRHRYGELVEPALDLAAAAIEGRDGAEAKAALMRGYQAAKPVFDSRFAGRNLHCDGLAERRFTDWS